MRRPLMPFENMDIRTLIDAQALRRADHPFLLWEPLDGETRRWSYTEFFRLVRRFAAGLQVRGVTPGQRILLHFDNCPEAVIAWLGSAYAGAVPVTTNARSTEAEIAYFADHCGAVAAITQPCFAQSVRQATPKVAWRAVSEAENNIPIEGFIPFADIDDEEGILAHRPHDPWAHFGIQYTSGTTSRPKAVLWTHANALWGARVSAQHEDLRDDDVHLIHLPLFHTNAQVYSLLATLWAGGTAILMSRFSASRFWPISLKHKATWTSMVPFCAKALLKQPVPANHSYRYWGNSVCEPTWDQYFNVRTIGWWGMTETVTHGIVGAVHHNNPTMSLGRPAPEYGIHVLDENGHPVASGEVGDLYVAGQAGVSLFMEYANDPKATAAAFRADGLFITGDRVKLGFDGALYFADRAKDMLKVGGENVAASEIERVIAAVEGVAEVAVVGMRHDMLDEVPAAFVIPRPGYEGALIAAIQSHCMDTLAQFKRPHFVKLVDDLPRATLGKVAKAELRAVLASGVLPST